MKKKRGPTSATAKTPMHHSVCPSSIETYKKYDLPLTCSSHKFDPASEIVKMQMAVNEAAHEIISSRELNRDGVALVKTAMEGLANILPYVTSKAPVLSEVKQDTQITLNVRKIYLEIPDDEPNIKPVLEAHSS